MKAVEMSRYGSVEVLELREREVPRPGPGEILVEVHATGLNPVDYKIRQGHLQDLFAVTFPRILGGDVSGVVRERGPGAEDFEVGDEVFFSNPLDRDGGYAEYVVVEQNLVGRKPPSLSHVEAASLPVTGLTSIQALRDFGGLEAGHKVLIHAGSGGVGSFAIQYAKSVGAEVYTTTSADNREYVTSLGADHVIDYRTEDFLDLCGEGRLDVVFETLGGPGYARSLLAVREGGAVPCIVNPPDADVRALAERRKIKTDFLLLQGNRKDLNLIAKLVETGAVRPNVTHVLPLEQVRRGHEQLESGRTRGKVVLKIR